MREIYTSACLFRNLRTTQFSVVRKLRKKLNVLYLSFLNIFRFQVFNRRKTSRWSKWFEVFGIKCKMIFFSIWIFFHEHSQFTGQLGKAEAISLTPHYHFQPLHRHLDISQVITVEISPLLIASNRIFSLDFFWVSYERSIYVLYPGGFNN